jgi:D-glycero-alpha-D-manno-heptose 1-phosphate guanylyltransferase
MSADSTVDAKSTRAFILAGGLGTRLRSVVSDRPKPMAPIEDKPFLEHQIEFLKGFGITDIVLCVGYQHEHIEQYFHAGDRWGVNVQYSIESEQLGTAGALKNAAGFVNGRFLVCNGDTHVDLDIKRFIHQHVQSKRKHASTLGSIALMRVADGRSCGTVDVDRAGRITAFHEKQARTTSDCLVSAGVYIFEPELLDLVPSGQKSSLEYDVYPQAINNDLPLFGHVTDGFFVDIGTPDGYQQFQQYMGRRSHVNSM